MTDFNKLNDNDPCPGGCDETCEDCTCETELHVLMYSTPEDAEAFFKGMAEKGFPALLPGKKVQ